VYVCFLKNKNKNQTIGMVT